MLKSKYLVHRAKEKNILDANSKTTGDMEDGSGGEGECGEKVEKKHANRPAIQVLSKRGLGLKIRPRGHPGRIAGPGKDWHRGLSWGNSRTPQSKKLPESRPGYLKRTELA